MFKIKKTIKNIYVKDGEDYDGNDEDYYIDTSYEKFELSCCKNKIYCIFECFEKVFVYDLKKEKYEIIDSDWLFDCFFYKNKYIEFKKSYGCLNIMYKKNNEKYYYKSGDIYYDESHDRIRYYFCKKSNLLFVLHRISGICSFGADFLSIFNIKNDLTHLNTIRFLEKENCDCDIYDYDYKKNILILSEDNKIKYEVDLNIKISDELIVKNVNKKYCKKEKISKKLFKINKKHHRYIFDKNKDDNLIIKKNNFSGTKLFFRIKNINRYNKKIKLILKYMLLNKKFNIFLIDEIITNLKI